MTTRRTFLATIGLAPVVAVAPALSADRLTAAQREYLDAMEAAFGTAPAGIGAGAYNVGRTLQQWTRRRVN
jgi:hypothetical protein